MHIEPVKYRKEVKREITKVFCTLVGRGIVCNVLINFRIDNIKSMNLIMSQSSLPFQTIPEFETIFF